MSKKHVELSPSSAQRWWNCPGSVALCRTVPKSPSSEHAHEGTVAHTVLERCLKSQDGYLTPFDMEGMEIEGVEVTQEMAESVAIAVDFARAEAQKGGILLVEQEVVLIPDVVEGTLDFAIVRPFDKIILGDYKHGKGVLVRPDDNFQLLIYALSLAKKYEVKEIELVIIQPRAYSDDPIGRWSCDMQYLDAFEPELERHIALTRETNALLIPGEKQCKWCDAKAVCPELRQEVAHQLLPVKGSELLFPKAETLPIATVAKLLDATDLIDDWFKSIWAHAQSLLENGVVVPGYELKKKTGHRIWIDEAAVAEKLGHLGTDIFTMKLKSPAQIEKLVGKEEKKELKELIETPDKGMVIAKVNQKTKGKKDDKKESIN